jgi:hypothetical protein
MLRCIPDAERVADLLAEAMTEARKAEAATAQAHDATVQDTTAQDTPSDSGHARHAGRPAYGVREPAAAH